MPDVETASQDEPSQPVPDDVARLEAVPGRVQAAFQFIALCTQHMGKRVTGNSVSFYEWEHNDLHPKQEAAFRCACEFLGRYFSGGEG